MVLVLHIVYRLHFKLYRFKSNKLNLKYSKSKKLNPIVSKVKNKSLRLLEVTN